MGIEITTQGNRLPEKDRSEARALGPLSDTGEVDLRGVVRAVLRRKIMMLLIVIGGVSAAQAWIIQTPPRYGADALIMIESQPSRIVVVDGMPQQSGGEMVTVNTQIAVLKSRSLAAKVIDELKLDKDSEFAPSEESDSKGMIRKNLDAAVGFVRKHLLGDAPAEVTREQAALEQVALEKAGLASTIQPGSIPAAETENLSQRQRAILINNFIARLSVKAEDQSRLINISFESANAAKSALITNTLLKIYIQSQLEAKTEGARAAAQWLGERLSELGATVKDLEATMQQRRSELGLIQDDGMNIATQRLNQLNFELVRTGSQRAVTQARYSRISGFLKTGNGLESLPEVISSSSIQSLRAKLIGLDGQLSDLSQRYGPGHRSIAPIQAEIKSLRQQLMAEMRTVLNGVSNELETLQAQEEALKQQLDAAGNEVGRLSNGALTIRQLSTQLEANRDLYESLLKRHTETVALRDNQQPDTRVISDAQIPLSPTFPKKSRTLALATVGSIAFAFFVIFLAERFRNRFDRGEDIAQQLRLQVIAIPDLPRLWRMMAMKPRHFIEREPLSEFGSAFQRLRALLALGNSRRMPSIVLVTSTVAGEGKTTVAVCLGIASVSSGQRVIIVDCDFLQPSVHNVMGIDNGAGLSEVLIGTSVLEDVVRVISPSMAVLPSGNVRRGGIDLLNSSRMAMLLRTLQGNFDLVILDSAPVMRLSDPLILGSFADKTLLVTRRDWTTQNNAAEVASQLMLYGADIAAVIFNRSNDVMARDR